MIKFEDYSDRYTTIELTRNTNGVVLFRLHTNGGPWIWNPKPVPKSANVELADAVECLSRDPDNRVVIITGTGDQFSGPRADKTSLWPEADVQEWAKLQFIGNRSLLDLLDIPVPVISCLNGPAYRHAQIPFTADIVLAAEEALIQDSAHFPIGIVPGDGIALLLPFLMGWNRGRYFHLTGQKIEADELQKLGLVNEVMPRQDLLSRAWELADQLAAASPLTLRYTRYVFTEPLKRLLRDHLPYSHALEALSAVDEVLFRQNSGVR